MEAFRAGHYRVAINAFHDADRRDPSPALSFDVALAHEQLGETARALEHYRKYLRRAPDAPELPRVKQRIAELEATLVRLGLQQVTVESSPAGAALSIDGTPLGWTPWTGELELGEHQLVVSHADHQTRAVAFPLTSAGAADVEVVLPRLPTPAAAPHSDAPHSDAPHSDAPHSDAPHSDAPPSDAPPVPDSAPSELDGEAPRWSFLVLGAGAASLVGAGVFEVLRQQEEQTAESARYQIAYEEAYERQQSRQSTARALLAVGGALVVTGGVLLWVESRPEESPSASLSCGSAGCFGALRRPF
jgi:tetratricopeptide (TPR) repeat protein